MLQLVLGVAGTGKSTRLMEEIHRRAAAGLPSILLVPEQFSAAAEGMAYARLGDAESAVCEVLSFRTLAERILRHAGGLQLPVLAEADRAVFVRRALDAVASELAGFARQRRSAAFCNLCAHTLAELKTAGATPEKLRDIAKQQEDGKLLEIALVYAAYEAAIAGAAVDPEDRLALAAARADGGYLEGKACFVDSFDGFTAPEYQMLEQLLRFGGGLWVALCCPDLYDNEAPGLFGPVRKAAHKLNGLAQKAGQALAPPLQLKAEHRPQAAGLLAVNRLLAGEGLQPAGECSAEGVTLTAAENEWEELRLAAAEMHRLALSGVPYSKMALVCRDVAAYESVARRQLELYGIPCFADFTQTIEYTAPVAFLRAALALLRGGLGSAAILALLKTGLCGCDEAELAALENYVFTWDPKADDWRAPFTGHPDGLLLELDETAEAQLAAAEGLRAAVVPVLEDFVRRARKANARSLSRRLYLLLDHFKAAERTDALADTLEQRGELTYATQLRRAWDLAMQLLDRMALLLGDEQVSADEYDELLVILVRSTEFGSAPQTLECALLSGADRMRLAEPDYCFVLGLCEGEFPMQVGYSGLLTHNDRDLLVAGGIEMPGSFENRSMLEEMFFYRALSSPRKGLYLSWPKRRAGAAKSISAALEPVADLLAPPTLQLPPAALAATPAAAYDLLGEHYRDNSATAATLYAALEGYEGDGQDWPGALELLRQVDNPGLFQVADQGALSRLVGRQLTLSATVAEQYFNCRFSYYMERVLRVRPRRKAELSPMESGTFVHHVLEQVLLEAGAGFKHCADEQLAEMAARHADEFIAQYLPQNTRRSAWQLEQIKAVTTRLLCYMRSAAAQSEFEVAAVELSIGGQGGVAPLEITTPAGNTVRVTGKIDRVDVLHRDGSSYLCIVDYKTGDKKMNLKELYHGLNMQMMIYMDALCQSDLFENPVPAAALYLGGDPAPAAGARGEGTADAFTFNGLLLGDGEVLRALDASGAYMPVRYNKDGSPRASASLASGEKFSAIRRHVRGLLADMAEGIHGGSFPARPLVTGSHNPCQWCAYRAACRHEDGQNEPELLTPENLFAPPEAAEGGEGA